MQKGINMKKCFLIIILVAFCFSYGQNEKLDLEKDILTWDKVETANFIIYYQPNTIVPDKNKFAEGHEKAFEIINKTFQSKLPKKITMLVWNSDDDARKYGVAQLGFANPEKCFVFKRANQTVGHEITHVISYYVSENPQRNRFVNEGIATAFNLSRDNKLETARKIKKEQNYIQPISIKEAWNNPDKYPEWVYYSLAGEFIQRLIKSNGINKFLQLAGNQSYENAKNIYGSDLDIVIDHLEKQIN